MNDISKFDKNIQSLDRMKYLCDALNNPQDSLKIIHIAGTNGKGSVSQLLNSVLISANYDVGLFISPYIECFNERIQFNNHYISDEDFNRIRSIVESKIDEVKKQYSELTFSEFDILTAVCFIYFKEKNVDYVVLETGLGGRLDSTNIIKPKVCVITSISLEHQAILGDSIEKIAYEKAGIIKNRIDVITSAKERALDVIKEKAKSERANLYTIDSILQNTVILHQNLNELAYKIKALSFNFKEYTLRKYFFEDAEISLGLLGAYQVENSLLALKTLEILSNKQEIDININVVKQGLRNARHKGRFEVISKTPLIILDGAHNHDGVESLLKSIDNIGLQHPIFIAGVFKDKDYNSMMMTFKDCDADFILTRPYDTRGLEADIFKTVVENQGIRVIYQSDDVSQALSRAIDIAVKENRPLLCFGSLYLISEIRSILLDKH